MSTQELIAAALTAVDELHDINRVVPIHDRIENQLREACARAMVQPAPDMAEVERLIDAFGSSRNSVKKFGHITSFKPIGQQITERREARTALFDYVRGVLAERDALIADNERLMRIAVQEVSAVQQPVGAADVPMPEENILKIRALDSAEVRWIDREALRTYGNAREAAGYAAGLAAGGKDAERYRWLRRKFAIIGTDCGAVFAAMNLPLPTYVAPDAAIELDAAIDAALRGEVK